MGTTRRNPFFEVISSYVQHTISALETRFGSNPSLFLSEDGISWARLSSRLLLDTFVLKRRKSIAGCKPFFIVADASIITVSVVISDPFDPSFHTPSPTPLFQRADLLQRSHRTFVFNNTLEPSLTDCERITGATRSSKSSRRTLYHCRTTVRWPFPLPFGRWGFRARLLLRVAPGHFRPETQTTSGQVQTVFHHG